MQNIILMIIGIALAIFSLLIETGKRWSNVTLFSILAFLAAMTLMASILQTIYFPESLGYYQVSKLHPDLFAECQYLGSGLVPLLFVIFVVFRLAYRRLRLPMIQL